MKYILIHGGVISGVGKGIISSSIGTLMKSLGLRVTAIKIDPYLNIDAGTFNPYEHGEVYVLDDGGEVRGSDFIFRHDSIFDIKLMIQAEKCLQRLLGPVYQKVNCLRMVNFKGRVVKINHQKWVLLQNLFSSIQKRK